MKSIFFVQQSCHPFQRHRQQNWNAENMPMVAGHVVFICVEKSCISRDEISVVEPTIKRLSAATHRKFLEDTECILEVLKWAVSEKLQLHHIANHLKSYQYF